METSALAFEQAITRAAERWSIEPFEWGKTDCLLSLADIYKEVLGYDPAETYRGRYKTARGAARVTKADGGIVGAFEYMARFYRWREVEPKAAPPGSVGLIGNRIFVILHFRGNSGGGLWVQRLQPTGFGGEGDAAISKAWAPT